MKAAVVRFENVLATLALGAVMALPLAEIAWRKTTGQGILGAGPIANWLTMWVGLLGGAVAARDGKLLTLATGEVMPKGRLCEAAHVLSGFVSAMVAIIFAAGGWKLVETYRAGGDMIATLVPMWIGVLVLPVGFGLGALRLARRAPPPRPWPLGGWPSGPHQRSRGLAVVHADRRRRAFRGADLRAARGSGGLRDVHA